jgi:hypothetical protein
MKAFIQYGKDEINLRKLLRKMQDYGTVTCTFEQFNELYCRWHKDRFKGLPVNTNTAVFREDWFIDFIGFLANSEV